MIGALVDRFIAMVRGEWSEKPHGGRARSLLAWCGESTAQLDISVMPSITPSGADE